MTQFFRNTPAPSTQIRSASNFRSTSSLSRDRYQDTHTLASIGYTSSAGEPKTGESRGRTRVTRDKRHVFTTGPLAGKGFSSFRRRASSATRVPFSNRNTSRNTSTARFLNSAPIESRVWKRNGDPEVSNDWDQDGSGGGLEGDGEMSESHERNRRNSLGTALSNSSQDRNPSAFERRQTDGGTYPSEALSRESDGRGIQNPKNVLVQLEKERSRCFQLESDYYALLRDYETIKERHAREVKIMEDQGTSESRNLQKAMVQKAKESAALNRRLRSTLKKHMADSDLWAERMETIQTEMERIQKLVGESEERTKTMQDRLTARETELKQASQTVCEKEAQLQEEKEAGTRLSGQVAQLERHLSQKEKDIRQLRETEKSRNVELVALAPFKSLAEGRSNELVNLQKRERQLRSELEAIQSRERTAREELEQSALRERKLVHDRDRLTVRETAHVSELEHLRTSESKFTADLKESSARLVTASEQISKLQSEQRRVTRDLQSAQHDLKSLRASFSDVRQKLSESEKARKALELRLETLSKDYTHSESQSRHVTEELTTARSTITGLNSDLSKARYELEEEQRKSAEAGVIHKEKLSQNQERVAGLEKKLKEVEEELEISRSTEKQLKDSVRQKEEERDVTARKLSDTNSALQREKDARANDKRRKKEDLGSVQEKFNAAQSAMDSELESLRTALTAKTSALATQTTQLSALRSEFSQTLQSREAQLRSTESQVSQYQSLLTKKDQEIQLMGKKLQNAGEQVRRFEKELHINRNAASGNGKGWTTQNHMTLARPVPTYTSDNHRIQYSVSDLTRRMREQVAPTNGDQSSKQSQPADVSGGNQHSSLVADPSVLPDSFAVYSQDIYQPPPATSDENEFVSSSSYIVRPGSPAVFSHQTSRQSLDPRSTAKGIPRSDSNGNRTSSANVFGNPFSDMTGEDESGIVGREGERERRYSELAGTRLTALEDSSNASHRGPLQGVTVV